MCARHRLIFIAIIVAAVSAIGLLVGCGGATTPAPAQPAFTPKSYDCSTIPGVEILSNSGTSFQLLTVPDSRQLYAQGQVIVIGSEKVISDVFVNEKVLALAGLTPQDFELIAKIDLTGLLAKPHPPTDLKFPADLNVRMYRVTQPALDALDVAGRINSNLAEQGLFAEPNYLFGRPIEEAQPWDIGSEPWDIGSEPIGPSGATSPGELFWRQWALSNDQGIGLGAVISAGKTNRGNGIQVAVFDTSPFSKPGEQDFTGVLTPALKLCVSHPPNLYNNWSSTDLAKEKAMEEAKQAKGIITAKTSDHGLFVAGLVHAVAPESKIHLIRTLDDRGRGDIFWLLANLVSFADTKGLTNTVINLSVGVNVSLPAGMDNVDKEKICSVAKKVPWIPAAISEDSCTLPVAFLQVLLEYFHDSGAVIVAAAGNDSAGRPPLPAEIPARAPFVIGVAARNDKGAQACFSNNGDVLAPGGDGKSVKLLSTPDPTKDHVFAPGGDGGIDCMSKVGQCGDELKNTGDCGYGLVSLLSEPYRFAYWAGTSFATPLMSGEAARLLSTGYSPSAVNDNITGLWETAGGQR